MSAKPISSKIRDVVFGILSFILSMLFTVMSFGLVIESTLLNKNAWIDNMNRNDYFMDKTEEIRKKLTDLTYATGLKEDFFDSVVDDTLVTEDTQKYIDGYFSGETTIIDSTNFKQKMLTSLDEYITENKIEKTDSKQIDKLVKEAEKIYKGNVSIMAIGSASPYFLTLKKVLPFLLIGVGVLALGLIAVLFFANKWKHRAYKYIYYASAGSFLTNLALAMYMSLSGGAKNIVLESRSLYKFVVGFVNSVNVMFWICAGLFLLVSVALFFAYRSRFLKLTKNG